MSAAEFVNEVWGLQGTAYGVVALRYYARITKTGWKSLGWDDLLMFLATVTYTAESTAAYFVVAYWKGYANNGMTDQERKDLEPYSEIWWLRVNGSKTHVIGLLLYCTLLWLLKGCWVIYYSRLTEGLTSRKKLVTIAWVMIPVTYIACLLVAFFKCIPFDHQWQIYPYPGNNCTPAVSTLQTVFVMVMNTLTDIYLMAIPLPMIWKAQLPLKKKLSICTLFSGGFIEMAFGLMRCISILTLGDKDPAQSGFWSVRESFVSFVLTNLPCIYPIIKSYIDKTRSSTNKSTMGYGHGHGPHGTGSNGYRLDSFPGKSRDVDMETGSKEHIVSSYEMKSRNANTTRTTTSLDASSEDSIAISRHPRRQEGPGLAATQVTISGPQTRSDNNTARNSMQSSGAGKGIFVTREYEIMDTHAR